MKKDTDALFVIILFGILFLVCFAFMQRTMYKDSKDKTIIVGNSIRYNHGDSISFTNFIDNHTIEY